MPCALQWWLTHNADGSRRTKRRNGNLLDPAGCDVATGFLLWLEKGAPGFVGGTGRTRVLDLVSCVLVCFQGCCLQQGRHNSRAEEADAALDLQQKLTPCLDYCFGCCAELSCT